MNEHQQIIGIVRSKNETPIEVNFHKTALLIVDMQRYFTQPSFPFTEVFEKLSSGASLGYLKRVRSIVIPNIQKLLSCFRELGSSVVFTAVGSETGDGRDLPFWLRSLDELGLAVLGKRIWPPVNDPSWEIDEALQPRNEETILNKLSAGTFATTGLEQRLRQHRIETVVVTGVSTDVCVSTTARESADRGFKTIIISDACTTLSEKMHQDSLDAFNIAFGSIRTTQEIVDLMNAGFTSAAQATAPDASSRTR
jgi:biuret amidohydrolase